eukprot:2455616-Prymnesium_polylepis.1
MVCARGRGAWCALGGAPRRERVGGACCGAALATVVVRATSLRCVLSAVCAPAREGVAREGGEREG